MSTKYSKVANRSLQVCKLELLSNEAFNPLKFERVQK